MRGRAEGNEGGPVMRRLARAVSFAVVLGLVFVGSQFLAGSTPAFADAPAAATCSSSGTADTVILAGQQATLTVAEDPSSNFSDDLYLNRVACNAETGPVKSITFEWAPPAGVSGQTVVFDESATVFPCIALSGAVGPSSPKSTDVVAVDDAPGGTVTVGEDGLSLASTCPAKALSYVGSWSLVGNGADTLSAQGTDNSNQATQPVSFQLGGATGSAEQIYATADSTLDFSEVPQPQGGCSGACTLTINSSTTTEATLASDTAQFAWGGNNYEYDFSAGAPSITTFVPVTGSPLTFYGQSAATYSFGAPLPAESQIFADHGVETFGSVGVPLQSDGSVTFIGGDGTDSFYVGGSAGSDTFEAGPGTDNFYDSGPDDTVDFANVATSATAELEVNASGSPQTVRGTGLANGQAALGSTTCTTFLNSSGSTSASDFTNFEGSSDGNTVYLAGPSGGERYAGSGANNSISFAAAASGVTVDLADYATSRAGTVTGLTAGTGSDPTTDTITALPAVTGSDQGQNTFIGGAAGTQDYSYSFAAAGNHNTFTGGGGAATFASTGSSNTFVVGTGNETIDDSAGSGNTVDLSTLTDPAVVNVSGQQVGSTPTNAATTSGATYSFGSGQTSFVGSQGGTRFYAGGTEDSFRGQGLSGDTLSFAAAPGSLGQLVVCEAATSPCSTAGTTLAGGVAAESFVGISTFDGLAGGNTRFVADGVGGSTFNGSGSGNALDLSAAPKGTTVDLATSPGSVSLPKPDSFSGIGDVTGSSAGGTTFVAGSGSETFHNPGGSGDAIDFSQLTTSSAAPLVVNASGGPVNGQLDDTAAAGPATYTFRDGGSGFTSFDGAGAGNTDFLASGTGGYSFAGAGSGDSLSFAAAARGVSVNLQSSSACVSASESPCAAADTDSLSGISTVTGSSAGHNVFVGGAGPETDTLVGPGTGNTFTVGSGSLTLEDPGAGNTIDLSTLTDPAVVNVSGQQVGSTGNDTATTSGATYSFGSAQTSFVGSQGGTRFYAGGTEDSFRGQGLSGDTLSFAAAPGSLGQLVVCEAATSPCSTAGTTLAGGVTAESFVGISTFDGLAAGNTRFVAAGVGGSTFNGSGSGNALDLSAAPKGTTVDLATSPGSVSLPKPDSFSGIGDVTGSSAGGTTFVAGSGSETFHNPGGSGDAIDFSQVASSGATPLVINASGGPVNGQLNDSAAVGPATYTFRDGGSGFASFSGAGTGNTDFLAPGAGGYSFAGTGPDNSLSFAAAGHGVRADLGSGSACVVASENPCAAADTDSLSGISTVTGSSAGHNVFVGGAGPETDTLVGPGTGNTFTVGSGSLTLEDPDAGNTIDLSGLSAPAVVNVSGRQVGSTGNDRATTSSATYSFGSAQTSFVGSQGGTKFYAGGTDDSFTGQGSSGDTLSFAAAPGSLSELLVCEAATSPCPSAGTTFAGVNETESFANISAFFGLAGGDTRFVADGSSGLTFDGTGSGNALDLSAAPAGVTVDLATAPGSVSVPGAAKPDSFSGIGDVTGSSAGGTTFVAGSSSETFHNPGGSGDAIDFSQVHTSSATPLVVYAGGPVNGPHDAAIVGSTGYDFTDGGSGFTSFDGAHTGYTDFVASDTSGYSFTGGASGDALDVGGAGSNVTLSVPAGTVELASGSDEFSGITTFSSSGNTTFVPGRTGGDTFHGAAGDSLDLGGSGSGDSVSVPTGTITLPSGTDQFTGIAQFVGSTSGATTVVAGSSPLDFVGRGPGGNELDLSQVSVGPVWVNAGSSNYLIPPGYPNAGNVLPPGTAWGSATYTFNGVSVFAGSTLVDTHFVADGSGGYTFSGSPLPAVNNWLDLTLAGPGVSVSVPTGTVSPGSGTDTISGIKNFVGSGGGHTTFVPATDSGSYTFDGQGLSNVLDLSAAPAGTTVTVSGPPAMSGRLSIPAPSPGPFSDGFSGIQSVNGPVAVKSLTAVHALPASVPAGVVGSAYSVQLSGSGGTEPYGRWSIFNGALPPGLTLSSAGLLAGTPTTTGTFSFVVGLVDNGGFGMPGVTSYTLTVNSAPAFTSADSATFHAGTASSFTVTTTGTPTPSITDARFAGCTPSKLTPALSLTDHGNGTATIAMSAKPPTPGTFTLCLVASNKIGSPATQKFTLTVARRHH